MFLRYITYKLSCVYVSNYIMQKLFDKNVPTSKHFPKKSIITSNQSKVGVKASTAYTSMHFIFNFQELLLTLPKLKVSLS